MRFDGFSVDTYQGRFAGTFDVELQDGETYLRYGNNVVMVVIGTVGPATMKEDNLGDMKRVNTLNVEAARFVSVVEQSDLLTAVGIPHQLGLPLTPQDPPQVPQGGVDEKTGEILTPVESESEAPALRRPEDSESIDVDAEGVVGRIPPSQDKHLARFLQEVP